MCVHRACVSANMSVHDTRVIAVVESVALLTAPIAAGSHGNDVSIRIWPDQQRHQATTTRKPTRSLAPHLSTVVVGWLVHGARRIPWVVLLLCIAQCAVFGLYAPASGGVQLFGLQARRAQRSLNATTSDALRLPDDWWRYLSYSLQHVCFAHLGVNVALLLLVGLPLELEQGSWRVLVVFGTAVWGGALASARWKPQQQLVGASAGVMGVLLSHVPHTAMVS